MSANVSSELHAFRQFLDAQIESGRDDLTPEESLRLWRAERQEFEESVAAIREALAELDAGGKGTPLDEFVKEFRRQHNISPDA
jgi:hypothetical protein